MIRKSGTRKWWFILVLMVVFIGILWWQHGQKTKKGTINVEEILLQSELRNRTFNSTVQKIAEGKVSAYLMEEHSNPIVAISFIFERAGVAYEPDEKAGIAQLVAAMLIEGAGEYNALQFKQISEQYGIKIGFSASMDDFSGYLIYPRQHQDIAAKLLKAALLRPMWDKKYLDLNKEKMLLALQKQQEHPSNYLSYKFRDKIFAGHPYSRNILGNQDTIPDLTAEDLANYHKTYLAQNNLIIGIAGDITKEKATTLLRELFAGLPEKNNLAKLEPLHLEFSGKEYKISRKIPQVITKFATEGTYRQDIDFYPLYLANYIFGEQGLNSRLSKVIREKEGLTYGIYTYLSISEASALIVGSFSATPDNFYAAKELLLHEWQRLLQDGVSSEELRQVKTSLINEFNLRFADINDISDMLVTMQKYNLGQNFLDKRNDYINEVELQEVNAAIKKYFSTMPDFVTIGDYEGEK